LADFPQTFLHIFQELINVSSRGLGAHQQHVVEWGDQNAAVE
jgi:hypothetical protein